MKQLQDEQQQIQTKQAKMAAAAMEAIDKEVGEKQKKIAQLEQDMKAATPAQRQKIQEQMKQLQDEQQKLKHKKSSTVGEIDTKLE